MSIKSSAPVFFNPEKIGRNIQEVGIDYVVVENKEIETRWFRHAESETDIFIWSNKKNVIIKQQVNMMGQIAEWNVIDGLKTGYLMETDLHSDEGASVNHQPSSEIMHFDRVIQLQTIELAKNIITNMSCLSEDEKINILNNFSGRSLLFKKEVVFGSPKPKSLWDKLLSVFKIKS